MLFAHVHSRESLLTPARVGVGVGVGMGGETRQSRTERAQHFEYAHTQPTCYTTITSTRPSTIDQTAKRQNGKTARRQVDRMPSLRDERRAADAGEKSTAGGPSHRTTGSLDLKPRPRFSEAVSNTTAYLSPFATAATQSESAVRDGAQPETNRLLADLAPHIMRPRVLQAAAAASASIARTPTDPTMAMVLGRPAGLRITNPVRSLLRFRNLVKNGPITASDLQLAETSNQILLSAALGDDLDTEPTGVAADVSLLRGFQATLPSALDGRTRRRKARGRDAPHMGLLAMGNSARGLLTDHPEAQPVESTPSTKDARKVRRANTRKRDIPLGVDELQAQLDEISLDKENLTVRRVRILSVVLVVGGGGAMCILTVEDFLFLVFCRGY